MPRYIVFAAKSIQAALTIRSTRALVAFAYKSPIELWQQADRISGPCAKKNTYQDTRVRQFFQPNTERRNLKISYQPQGTSPPLPPKRLPNPEKKRENSIIAISPPI